MVRPGSAIVAHTVCAMSHACHVGVQSDAGRLDFVLPADVAVAAVIPSIVDHAAVGAAAGALHSWQEVPADWQLSRIDGRPLSPRTSLRDNGIRDGDILWLNRVRTAVASAPSDDVIARMSTSLDTQPRWTPKAGRIAASIILLCSAALNGYALLASQSHQGEHASAVTAGLLCASAFIVAVACGRAYRDGVLAPVLGSCATAYAAMAGYLVVPGDAVAPKLTLAGAVGATVVVLAARHTGSGTAVFSATAAFGYLASVAACAHLFVAAGVEATGAMLGAAATVMLAWPARLAIWAGRLRVPRLPVDDADRRGTASRARRAHEIVTGLVCGFSAAAALGAALAAVGGNVSGAVFAVIVGLVLLLRTGTHVDLVQTAALMAGGASCLVAVFLWAVGVWRPHANWISLGAAAMAAGGAVLLTAPRSATASPLARRFVELTEYAALAAVIPVACWVCGVFGAVRGVA